MTNGPSVAEQEHLVRSRRTPATRMRGRELLAATAAAVGFLLASAALWRLHPPHDLRVSDLGLTLLVAVIANRVRFETPLGFAPGVQIAFVPLALTLPPAIVPVAACAALAISAVPDVVTGRLTPARLLFVFRNCAYALGPAWVLALCAGGGLPRALVLVAALAAQFLLDFVVFTATVLAVRGSQVRQGWVYGLDVALSCIGYLVALQTQRTPAAILGVLPLLGLLAMFGRERSGRLQGVLELGETYRGTAMLLGDVVAADDNYTGLHSQGVVVLALAVGDALGLTPDRRRNLEFAALLHDVGKITIPKEIIHKPGKLDPDEWRVVQTHSAAGQQLLARVGGFMTEVGEIVRSHHERWDGAGYPDGLRGDAAPLEARIITCCDSWSAMRTDRPYRPAMSREAAVQEVVRNVGAQFDPRVADALLTVVAESDEDASAAVAAGLQTLLGG